MPLEEDTHLTKDIKKGVLAYIKEKYSNLKVNDLLDAATFMDPTEYTDEVDKYGVIECINEEAIEIVRSSQAHSNPPEQSEHQDGHTDDTNLQPTPAKPSRC